MPDPDRRRTTRGQAPPPGTADAPDPFAASPECAMIAGFPQSLPGRCIGLQPTARAWVHRTAGGVSGAPRRFKMAVQQNQKTPSKRGMHRSHNALTAPGTAIEATTGEVHLRHHISPTGFYRGRKVLKTKADA